MYSRGVTLLLFLVCIGLSGRANADEDPGIEAKRQYEEGVRAFRLGRFEIALQAFTRSYELFPSPVSLFNRAQALRLLHDKEDHDEEAIFAYKQYVTLSPDGKYAQVSTDMIAQLQKRIAERKAAEARRPTEAQRVPVAPKDPPPRAVETTSPVLVTPAVVVQKEAPRRRSRAVPAAVGVTVAVVVVGAISVGLGFGLSASAPLPDTKQGNFMPVFP